MFAVSLTAVLLTTGHQLVRTIQTTTGNICVCEFTDHAEYRGHHIALVRTLTHVLTN